MPSLVSSIHSSHVEHHTSNEVLDPPLGQMLAHCMHLHSSSSRWKNWNSKKITSILRLRNLHPAHKSRQAMHNVLPSWSWHHFSNQWNTMGAKASDNPIKDFICPAASFLWWILALPMEDRLLAKSATFWFRLDKAAAMTCTAYSSHDLFRSCSSKPRGSFLTLFLFLLMDAIIQNYSLIYGMLGLDFFPVSWLMSSCLYWLLSLIFPSFSLYTYRSSWIVFLIPHSLRCFATQAWPYM